MNRAHVKLPIFNDEGMETGRTLEISTAILEYLASSSVIWKDHVAIVESLTPEQEVEMLENIIHDIPTIPHRAYYEAGANDWIGEVLTGARQSPWKKYNQQKLEEESERSWDEKILDHGRLTRIHLVPGDEGIGHIHVTEKLKPPVAHFALHTDGTIETLVDPEDVAWGRKTEWRPIPGFTKYEMNYKKRIVTAEDGKSVSIVKGGRFDNALLTDDEGRTRRMSVDHLFKQTFPEL